MAWKIKQDKQDKEFSKLIRERDNNTCVFCGKSADFGWVMSCSHFWSRGHKCTRFDPDNCDTLCFACHFQHESNKQGFYRDWKIKQLGKERYNQLEKRSKCFCKYGVFEKKIILNHLKTKGLNDIKTLFSNAFWTCG